MLELIAIVAAAAICILTPIEVGKIQKGWMRKNFKGTHEQFIVAYGKQLTIMMYVGVVFAIFNVGLGIFEERAGENYIKYFAGALWFAVSAISFIYKGKLASQPSP